MTLFDVDYYELLEHVFKISPSIRFVGIYDCHFNKITDDFQPGILQHLSREEMQNSTRYDLKRWETYKIFQQQYGETNYAMVKYDKVALAIFPIGDKVHLRVSMEPNADHNSIIERIQNLLRIPIAA
ncbi:MAG: hypothetical protein EB170_00880 [Nitrosopumilaceae archaeon]|nr:hypothetical protein [Nitrosopumilaceae archaeon]NDB62425.1 hypothetical protein [Nitrosopumilaceae archaeon]